MSATVEVPAGAASSAARAPETQLTQHGLRRHAAVTAKTRQQRALMDTTYGREMLDREGSVQWARM